LNRDEPVSANIERVRRCRLGNDRRNGDARVPSDNRRIVAAAVANELAAIYAKTGTRRHAKLVAILNRFALLVG
jgi:hypothetical protein